MDGGVDAWAGPHAVKGVTWSSFLENNMEMRWLLWRYVNAQGYGQIRTDVISGLLSTCVVFEQQTHQSLVLDVYVHMPTISPRMR